MTKWVTYPRTDGPSECNHQLRWHGRCIPSDVDTSLSCNFAPPGTPWRGFLFVRKRKFLWRFDQSAPGGMVSTHGTASATVTIRSKTRKGSLLQKADPLALSGVSNQVFPDLRISLGLLLEGLDTGRALLPKPRCVMRSM